MTDFYVKTGIPASHSGPAGTSAAMRAEFTSIETAMAKLAGYTGNGSKFLRVNAAGTAYEALTVADALAALAPSSAALATALTDTTGTGVFVRTQAPTLTSATMVTPALGTPASGVLTNCTGTAAGLTAGNVTTNANLTGHITSSGNAAVLGSFTSAQLATALTDETGSGAVVFATSPTLVTPALGTPSALVGTNITGTAAGLTAGTATTATTATTAAACSGNAATATTAGTCSDEIGVSQTWTNVVGTRALRTLYTNATARPIMVTVTAILDNGDSLAMYTNNAETIIAEQYNSNTSLIHAYVSAIIPAGGNYYVGGGGTPTMTRWVELR